MVNCRKYFFLNYFKLIFPKFQYTHPPPPHTAYSILQCSMKGNWIKKRTNDPFGCLPMQKMSRREKRKSLTFYNYSFRQFNPPPQIVIADLFPIQRMERKWINFFLKWKQYKWMNEWIPLKEEISIIPPGDPLIVLHVQHQNRTISQYNNSGKNLIFLFLWIRYAGKARPGENKRIIKN